MRKHNVLRSHRRQTAGLVTRQERPRIYRLSPRESGYQIPGPGCMLSDALLPDSRRGGYGMGMPELSQVWTREMVLALPDDGNRYELLGGELLVTPAPRPRHQLVVGALSNASVRMCARRASGTPWRRPADLSLGGEQLVQPDVFVVAREGRRVPEQWSDVPSPLLVVEVLSPSTASMIARSSVGGSNAPESRSTGSLIRMPVRSSGGGPRISGRRSWTRCSSGSPTAPANRSRLTSCSCSTACSVPHDPGRAGPY